MNLGTVAQKVENVSVKALSAPLKALENNRGMRYLEKKLSEEVTTSSGKKVLKLDILKKHLPAIFGVWITSFYLLNIYRNKDIPKERKTPLAINAAFTGLFGASAGYYANAAIKKFEEPFNLRFEKILKEKGVPAEELKILKSGLKEMIPLLAFTFTFRYLAPVVATPIADKLNKFLIKHNLIKDSASKPDTSLERFRKWNSGLPKLNLNI